MSEHLIKHMIESHPVKFFVAVKQEQDGTALVEQPFTKNNRITPKGDSDTGIIRPRINTCD